MNCIRSVHIFFKFRSVTFFCTIRELDKHCVSNFHRSWKNYTESQWFRSFSRYSFRPMHENSFPATFYNTRLQHRTGRLWFNVFGSVIKTNSISRVIEIPFFVREKFKTLMNSACTFPFDSFFRFERYVWRSHRKNGTNQVLHLFLQRNSLKI